MADLPGQETPAAPPADSAGREYPSVPRVAVGAMIARGDRVLLVRRGREPAKGIWTVPGGGVELGETVEEAVRREIREETGLEITLHGILGVFDRVQRTEDGRVRYHYVIIDFAARSDTGEPTPGDDVDAAAWRRPDEIEDPLLRDLAERAIAAASGEDLGG
jgi:ADP-ribose pyrophosphatase YjhB (NUDIX family)